MDRSESTSLNILRVVMMMAVICLHGQTSVQMCIDTSSLPVYSRIMRVVGYQFGELGVPSFFAISGYLLFINYQQTRYAYISKLKRRFHSLLIPYLFWNFLMLVCFYIVEYIPSVRELFNESRPLVQDYSGLDYLRAFFAEERTNYPIHTQLWFVRNLIFMIICAPLIYFIIRKCQLCLICVLAVIWFVARQYYCEVNTVFFFFLGAWFSINGKSMISTINRYRHLIVLLFLLLALSDVILMFNPVNIWLHRAVLLLGFPFVVTVISWLVDKDYVRDIRFLSASSFFVYLVHDPMLRYIRKASLKLLDKSSDIQMLIAYLGAILLDLLIVYMLYWILYRYCPKLLFWISGGRGG